MLNETNKKMTTLDLHIRHLFTEYFQGTTFLYHIDNPDTHIVGLRGKHSKLDMIKFYQSI